MLWALDWALDLNPDSTNHKFKKYISSNIPKLDLRLNCFTCKPTIRFNMHCHLHCLLAPVFLLLCSLHLTCILNNKSKIPNPLLCLARCSKFLQLCRRKLFEYYTL